MERTNERWGYSTMDFGDAVGNDVSVCNYWVMSSSTSLEPTGVSVKTVKFQGIKQRMDKFGNYVWIYNWIDTVLYYMLQKLIYETSQ